MRQRTVELLRVKASELRGDPRNFRRHPAGQKKALKAVLDDVGFAGAILARRDEAGALVIVDGHLRVETATADEELPVLVLDVDEKEAAKLLATFDPLGSMASADADAFASLRASLADIGGEMKELLDQIGSSMSRSELAPPDEFGEVDENIETEHTCPKCGYRFSGGS